MGNCIQITSKLEDIDAKLDKLEREQGLLLTALHKENAMLKRHSMELQMKIENYGMVFSGNPCRITPNTYDVSKRLGTNTI